MRVTDTRASSIFTALQPSTLPMPKTHIKDHVIYKTQYSLICHNKKLKSN